MLNSEHTAHLVGSRIGQRYRIGDFVAGGAFGSFHFGRDSSSDQKVAIKLEKKTAPLPQLLLEVTFYQR